MRFILPTSAFAAALLTGSLALAGNAHEMSGEITRLDASAHTLAVKETAAPRHELQLKLKTDAQIVANGKPEAFGDLKAGEKVKVSYTGTGAKREATRIEVLSETASKHS